MSDERLRELERKWKESGAADDGAFYLLELVRAGSMQESDLRAMAELGDEPAMKALGIDSMPSLPDTIEHLLDIHSDVVIRAGIALAHTCFESQFGNVDLFFSTDHYAQAYFAIERWFVSRSPAEASLAASAANDSINEESLDIEGADTSRAMNFIEAAEVAMGLDVIGAITDIPQHDLHNTVQLVLRTIERIQRHLDEDDHPNSEKVVRNWILMDLRPWLMGITDPIADRVNQRV